MTDRINAYVKASNVAGNGLFTDRTVNGGDLMVSIQRSLFTVVAGERSSMTCDYCIAQSEQPYWIHGVEHRTYVNACTGCHKVKYCSKVSEISTKNR